MKLISSIIISLLFVFSLRAQDIHFSQFNMSPLNLNPAESGLFNGEYRLTANHRNQWKSITVPYKTFGASFDWNMGNIFVPVGRLGTGIQFITDAAGDGNLTTNIVRWSGAYHYPLKSDSTIIYSLGFNINFNQHSIDYSKFYYGSQYNGFFYDPSLPTHENFTQNNMYYLDFAIGMHLQYTFSNGIPLSTGIAFNHLNKPEQSFFEEDPNELTQKFNFNIKSNFIINENIDFIPSAAIYRQGTMMEIYYGGLFKFFTNNSFFSHIYAGGWFRYKDAGIVKLGFDYQNVNIGLSYDLNYSSLKVASRGQGGPEIALVYIFNSPKPITIPPKKTCPVFL